MFVFEHHFFAAQRRDKSLKSRTKMNVKWQEQNRTSLTAALDDVRNALRDRLASQKGEESPPPPDPDSQAEEDASPPVSALDLLCELFGLSSFERKIVLLCAGLELENDFAGLCAALHGHQQRTYPTFGLALSSFPDPHWSALTPESPLRRWRLIDIEESQTLAHSPLRINESVLHYLMGLSQMDSQLTRFVEPVEGDPELFPSHQELADRMVHLLSEAVEQDKRFPVLQLYGKAGIGKTDLALAVCEALQLHLFVLPVDRIPTDSAELERMMQRWARDSALHARVLLVDAQALDEIDSLRRGALFHLLEQARGLIFLSCRDRESLRRRSVVAFEVEAPTSVGQRTIWTGLLAGQPASANEALLEQIVAQFNMGTASIRSAFADALARENRLEPGDALWDSCRTHSRRRMENLVQRIQSDRRWEDLVLSDAHTETLRNIAAHVRHRHTVYEQWGFRSKLSRGLGISALFSGASGTGKTMAAEVLANELRLDLYQIDLSAVMSKYIGETEKNLRRIFDTAEESGAILLFDEADALFGKRSDVKDSHDRHANIEVSYLLQRMESYRGLAILTSNMKDVLDPAFMRRIRFIVDFPFPAATQRRQIWQRIFPDHTPVENINPARLSQLNIPGGLIRNIALNAAFYAAEEGQPVSMSHLLPAAKKEYAKMGKTLTPTETQGWDVLKTQSRKEIIEMQTVQKKKNLVDTHTDFIIDSPL